MKTYLRFLRNHKLYTLIEFLGISVALAFIIPLMSYVNDLWNVDHGNRDFDRIYTFTLFGDYLSGCFDQPEFLEKNIPEVEQTTLFSATRPADIKVGDESYSIELLLCDLDYFDFFPTRFLSGSREVLQDNTNALVSESFAKKIGYGRDAVGKHFILDDLEYTIEGIVDDYDCALMRPHDVFINIAGPTLQYYWKNPQRMHYKDLCFFKVKPGTDREELAEKIRRAARVNYAFFEGLPKEQEEETLRNNVRLYRYDEVSGVGGGALASSNKYVFRVVLILSLVLLLFALFNYIALNVAMGTFRAKEMATRRLLGSTRGEIIGKLLVESLCLTTACFLLGLLLSYAIVPEINALFQANSELGFNVRVAFTGRSWLYYLLLVLFVGLIAGLIPSLIISRPQAIDVIKGEVRMQNKMVFSKVFIFVQCFVTMVLLVCFIVYSLQYRKMVRQPLGVDVEDVYWFYGPYAHHELDPCLEALRSLPCVTELGYCDDRPGMCNVNVFLPLDGGSYSMRENGEDSYVEGTYFSKLYCSRGAFDAYGFKIIRDYHREGEKVAWLTESFVKDLQLDPVDPRLTAEQMDRMGVTAIGGIVGDFRSSYYRDNAAFISVQEDWYESPVAYYKSFAIRTTGSHGAAEKAILDCMKETLDRSWGVYKEPHIKGYIPELNKSLLQSERAAMTVIAMFTVLMLVLSLLGMIGLSSWFVSLKEHDIAIRKVFGATVNEETWKNSRSYVWIVLAACLCGIPVAFWLCGLLLAPYAHRITVGPLYFIGATLLIVGFSLLAVWVQTLRVTRMNPAGVLKKE